MKLRHPYRLAASLVAAALVCVHPAWAADTYPSKPIRLVIEFAAGGGADVVGRLIASKMTQSLGQSMVVENRAGAGGMIANEYVAKSAPDGYTLLLGAEGALAIAPLLTPSQGFDPIKSLAPIGLAVSSSFILTVEPGNPANNLAELTKLIKANPGKYNFGSSGTGGSPHLAGELYKKLAGVDMVHVPYTGLAPALTALLGGQIQLVFADVGLVSSNIKAGKLKAIAVTGAGRTASLPQVPTMIESGLPGFVAGSWYGLFAPAGTPAPIITRLNTDLQKAIAQPDTQKQFVAQGLDTATIHTPAEFGKLLAGDVDRWSKVIKEAHIQAN